MLNKHDVKSHKITNMYTKESTLSTDKSIIRLIEKMRESNERKRMICSKGINKHNINHHRHGSKGTNNEPGITVMTSTMRPEFMNNVFDNYRRQTYKRKELIIVLNKNSMNINLYKQKAKRYPNVRIFQFDEGVNLAECYNFCVEKSKYDYIATFDDDDYYAPNYLRDTIEAFKYSGSDVVGKRATFIYFQNLGILALSNPSAENSFVDQLDGPTICFHKRIFDRVRFNSMPCGIDVKFCEDCIANGIKIYSASRFNFVYIRHTSAHSHTWKIDDQTLLGWCHMPISIKNYQKYVAR